MNMQIRTMGGKWYVCEFRGVCFVTWVCEKERQYAANLPRGVAEGMAQLVQENTGMQVEVVYTPCKPNDKQEG
jgi:hypothetical protein